MYHFPPLQQHGKPRKCRAQRGGLQDTFDLKKAREILDSWPESLAWGVGFIRVLNSRERCWPDPCVLLSVRLIAGLHQAGGGAQCLSSSVGKSGMTVNNGSLCW